MKSLKFTILTFLIFFVSTITFSQQTKTGNWCGFDKLIQKELEINPNFLQEHFKAAVERRSKLTNSKMAATYVIPVVVHNITHDGGVGYVTKQTIEDAINRLNIDFNRLNSDTSNTRALFKPYAGSIDIEFRLAHLDPNGDCTEGIVRLDHPSSADFSDNDKSISQWDEHKYFNIWLVDLINGSNPPSYIAGYAQFPNGFGGGIDNTYGVVVDNTFFGPNDRTLTHEIGHCFGLLHTFQGGCGSDCSSSGDGMCDTPPVDQSTQSCDQNQNTCTNDANGPDPYGTNVVDQIENYMSYDNCQNMFSLDQIAEMVSVLNNTSTTQGLEQLTQASNLAATGTADPYNPADCAPIADFDWNRDMICEGASVNFTDESYNATPNGWNWTFTGGTPSTSNQQNPTITYNTAGVYGVTHEPSSTGGNDVITKNNIITVSSLTADYTSPVTDGFENASQFTSEWIIGSGSDNNDWSNTTTAAATGSRSVTLNNYAANSSGTDVDYLISPSYDMTTSADKQLKFKVAFANRAAGNTDKLFIYYSTSCGASWSLKTPLTNANLTTAPDHTNSFIPTASEWEEKTIDFSSLGSNTNVRFKFEFTGGGGNNIYLDDINLGGTVGVDEFSNIANFSVFPNPTNSSAKIAFSLMSDVKNLSIKVKNALGQEVTNVVAGQSFGMGKYTLNIDNERKLAPGIYLIEFNADNKIKVQKLIVQ